VESLCDLFLPVVQFTGRLGTRHLGNTFFQKKDSVVLDAGYFNACLDVPRSVCVSLSVQINSHFVAENITAVNDADAKPMTSVNASTWRRSGNAAAAAAAAVLAAPSLLTTRYNRQ